MTETNFRQRAETIIAAYMASKDESEQESWLEAACDDLAIIEELIKIILELRKCQE